MKTEINRFVETLQKALGSQLQSVIWYGPACRNPDTAQPEEIQLLVIVDSLGVPELQALSEPVNRWIRKRHPFPKIFTRERLLKSTDVFPIECLTVQSHYQVMHGDDLVPELSVSDANLRLQLESEFKGKLLQLREAFLISGGKPKTLAQTLALSLSTFESLFAALARVLGQPAPTDAASAASLLADQLKIQDAAVLADIQQLRQGGASGDRQHIHKLFERYLRLIEQVSDKIDSL